MAVPKGPAIKPASSSSLAFAASLLAACHAPQRATVRGLGYHYADNSGISVSTAVVEAEQPVHRQLRLAGRALVDRISIERKPLDPGDPGHPNDPGGHPPHAPDAVSSASATAQGGAVAEELRVEGLLSATARFDPSTGPLRAGLSLRGSREPDYRALSATLSASAELFQRNTTVSGFAGVGRDRVEPVEAPPGQAEEWPASHHRQIAGLSLHQLLSSRIAVFGALGLTIQSGTLENPYRRALVRTSLFPEIVPHRRVRTTGLVGSSIFLGFGTALHARAGGYRDSWGLWALIPELALAKVLAEEGLLSVRYRYYRQSPADFYRARYPDLEELMTGDVRLGPIRQHSVGLGFGWTLGGSRGAEGTLHLGCRYAFTRTDYLDYATQPILGHIVSVVVERAY